jgi:hypothetical protein
MSVATAADATLFRIRPFGYERSPADRAAKMDRYVRLYYLSRAPSDASSNWPPALQGPTRFRPTWLPVVERRIRDSIARLGWTDDTDEGRWLSWATAEAARIFFDTAADVLPGEPYIYSSKQGDLVAEFQDERGTLTTNRFANFSDPIRKSER